MGIGSQGVMAGRKHRGPRGRFALSFLWPLHSVTQGSLGVVGGWDPVDGLVEMGQTEAASILTSVLGSRIGFLLRTGTGTLFC